MVVERMTRADQANRRKAIAAAVTDWASMARVAGRFEVSIETVKNACRIYAPQKMNDSAPRRPRTRRAS